MAVILVLIFELLLSYGYYIANVHYNNIDLDQKTTKNLNYFTVKRLR
ncbi:protein of unknown function [Vibrio tapetis subsp. tapetis]|uniref:Uncharacterized protein n=1 Tax=Vibrio tapetis subsp. tapetis TaxID=1671868 RepID=A0A2N8ZFC5_9VIBR|nr:protein of unknown function [Vibrio tapetis subsp. tapetis]